MAHSFDFDPQLRDLPLAFDLAAVAQLFAERWPRAGESGVTIANIKAQDVKYQPGKRCVTTYALTVERPGAPPMRTIGAIEITPEATTHRLYDDDAKLPWLALATDADGMAAVGNLADGTAMPMVWGFAACALAALVITFVTLRPGAQPAAVAAPAE